MELWIYKHCGQQVFVRVLNTSKVVEDYKKRYKITRLQRVMGFFTFWEGFPVLEFVMQSSEYYEGCGHEATSKKVCIDYIDSVRPNKVPPSRVCPKSARKPRINLQIMLCYFDYLRYAGFTEVHLWACSPATNKFYLLPHKSLQFEPKNHDNLCLFYRQLYRMAHEMGLVLGNGGTQGFRDAGIANTPLMNGHCYVSYIKGVQIRNTNAPLADHSYYARNHEIKQAYEVDLEKCFVFDLKPPEGTRHAVQHMASAFPPETSPPTPTHYNTPLPFRVGEGSREPGTWVLGAPENGGFCKKKKKARGGESNT